MKKRGFTLIELIAVIFLIGLIALIITPSVLNIVENSRKKAFLADVRSILSMAEANNVRTNYEKLTYTVTDNKIYDEDGNELDSGGSNPLNGTIKFDVNGKSSLAIYNNKWCATKSSNKNEIEITEYTGECGSGSPSE